MKFFEIVKFRWPEVAVVVVFQACCVFLFKDVELMTVNSDEYSARAFLLGICLAAFLFFSIMMSCGFFRAVAVNGTLPIQPGMLLSIGRGYCWKILLVLSIVLSISVVIVGMILGTLCYILGYEPVYGKIPLWLMSASKLPVDILMIKPFYFMPAIMLVGDLNMIEAFRYLRQLDLFRTGQFLPLAIGITLLTGAVEFLSASVHRTNIFFYPVSILQAVVIAGGLFVIFLSAVIELCKLKPKSPEKESENEQADI
jgi:hypothetical protein